MIIDEGRKGSREERVVQGFRTHCGVPFVYPGRFYAIIEPSRKRVFFVVQCLFKMKNDTRKITDGAMMAAIMGAAVLLDRQTAGLLQSLVLFLYPLPMVFYAVKYGWKNSLPVVAAIALLTFAITNVTSFVIVMGEMIVGLVYGGNIYAGVDTKRTCVRTMVVSVLVLVLTNVVFGGFFNMDLNAEAKELESAVMKAAEASNVTISTSVKFEQAIVMGLIMLVVTTGILYTMILHFVSIMMFKRMHIHVNKGKSLLDYIPQRWTGYVGIALAACFIYAFHTSMDNTVLKLLMEGIGFCGVLYLLWFGMSAIAYFLRLRGSMGEILPVVLAVLFGILTSTFVSLLGFLYITTDMRQRLAQGGIKNE